MTAQPNPAPPSHLWEGIYQTWEDACQAANSRSAGTIFSSERWRERITRQLLDYREEIRRFGTALPPRPCSLPLVCALTKPHVILDLGGSSGWGWDYLRNALPDNQVSAYYIVEIEAVARYMAESGLHTSPVRYESLPASLGHCDLIYCNSVLQYFASNSVLGSLVSSMDPEYVLLEDVIAGPGADRFTTQAYFGGALPYRFTGLSVLREDMSALGYQELLHCPYASPVLGVAKPFEMDNFSEADRLRYSSSILFKKCRHE